MNYSPLGSSSLRVSRISFGCMSIGTNEREAISLLQSAAGSGINYFDSADIYNNGQNESLLGKAFKDQRHNIILATKVGNVPRADGSGLNWNPSRKHILESVENSLKRLQTDYIDLYQLHGGTIQDPIEETIAAFEGLKQQGKIRFYGISSIRPNVIREYVNRSSLVSVMMQYSLLDRRPEEECLDLLQQHNVGVVVRGSVAQGLLAGKPAKPYLEHSTEQVSRAAQAMKSLANEHRNAAQAAISYVLRHPAVCSAVVGIRTEEQLQEAVKAIEAPELTDSELAMLRQETYASVYKEHR